MNLLDDAFELYNSKGGSMSREQYRHSVVLLFSVGIKLLASGKHLVLTGCLSIVPQLKTKTAKDKHTYYRLGVVPELKVIPERYTLRLQDDVKQYILNELKDVPL